eukprot:scaffold29247_cov69-Cyclotella_meneghiniana.AAC.4
MNLISASPSLLTALVLLSGAVWKASGQFTFVDDGKCADSAGQLYPSIGAALIFGTDQVDPQSCYDWCTQVNEEKLVGFQTYPYAGVNPTDYKNPSRGTDSLGNAGTGVVNSTIASYSTYDCYRNEVSLLCLEKTSCS